VKKVVLGTCALTAAACWMLTMVAYAEQMGQTKVAKQDAVYWESIAAQYSERMETAQKDAEEMYLSLNNAWYLICLAALLIGVLAGLLVGTKW
jgi:hypothetical protein